MKKSKFTEEQIAFALEQSEVGISVKGGLRKIFPFRPKCASASAILSVIADSEVWALGDCPRCRAVTGCDDVMIGCGALRTLRTVEATEDLLVRHGVAFLGGKRG